MPLDVGAHGRRADYKSEQQCQRTSLAFYRAVRDLLPVWLLEEMRATEAFHWEGAEGRACAFSPSEALLYALVHDHQPYARHLLSRHGPRALDAPSASFRCCSAAPPPHFSVAVRYNRTGILRWMTAATRGVADDSERRRLLNGRGCAHADGGRTPLHLACDLARPECALLLLSHGACPHATDSAGDTAVDCLLRGMRHGEHDLRAKRVCLGYLLLYMPSLSFRMRAELKENAALWSELLGEQTFRWLSGLSPPSLFVQSMRTVTRSGPAHLSDSLPDFLLVTDFRLH